jgi:hypothetical protein
MRRGSQLSAGSESLEQSIRKRCSYHRACRGQHHSVYVYANSGYGDVWHRDLCSGKTSHCFYAYQRRSAQPNLPTSNQDPAKPAVSGEMADRYFDMVCRLTTDGLKYKATNNTMATIMADSAKVQKDLLVLRQSHELALARIKAATRTGYANRAVVVAVAFAIGAMTHLTVTGGFTMTRHPAMRHPATKTPIVCWKQTQTKKYLHFPLPSVTRRESEVTPILRTPTTKS